MAWEVPDNACIEVLPPELPHIFLPDTYEGRLEARRLLADTEGLADIAFCSCYRKDSRNERLCAHRDLRYFDGNNRCRICPAGYMFEAMRGEIPDDEVTRAHKESRAEQRAYAKELDEAFAEAERVRFVA